MSDVNLSDLARALRCLASQNQAGDCYEQYYNFNNNGQRISCYGSPDTIKCPYNQSTYDVCFEDGQCSEWLGEAAELLEELQQYRQIGTVEDVTKRENDIRTLSGMFERLSDKEVAEYHELQEYQTIGTPEECREAKENQKKYIELAKKEYMCELYEKQITELSQTVQHWANEARMQTAAAGEMKNALTEKLEETRWRKEVVGGLITEARSDMDRVVLDWKLMQFEEQEKWLVEMLEKGRQAAGQEET